jgi:hypothetical protein
VSVLTGMVGMVEEHSGVISFKSEGIRNCPIVEVEHLEPIARLSHIVERN